MKKMLLLGIGLFICAQSFGQDPELFGTWYLYFVMDTDLGTPYEVSEIEPPINPFIIISETGSPEIIEVSGEGACNTFNATYFVQGGGISNTIFDRTIEDCGIQEHNSFENSFFGFMESIGTFNISSDSEGFTLYFNNPLMGYAIFKDYPLSIPEKDSLDFTIFPNPVSDKIFVISEKPIIETIEVFSMAGKKIMEVDGAENVVDVSALSKGIYFLEITSSETKSVQKFIIN